MNRREAVDRPSTSADATPFPPPDVAIARAGGSLLSTATTVGGALAGIGAVAIAVGALALNARASTLGIPASESLAGIARAGYFFIPDTFRAVTMATLSTAPGFLLIASALVAAIVFVAMPLAWRRWFSLALWVAAIFVGIGNAIWMSSAFDGFNRNLLSIPNLPIVQPANQQAPPARHVWVTKFHNRLTTVTSRAETVDLAYGWSVIATLFTGISYVAARRLRSLPYRRGLLRSLIALLAMQTGMLPAVYGSLLLTNPPACVTVLDPAHLAPVFDDTSQAYPPDTRIHGFLLSDLIAEEPKLQIVTRDAGGVAALHWVERAKLDGLEFSAGCTAWLIR